jgi:multidrug resistance protein, MATE family
MPDQHAQQLAERERLLTGNLRHVVWVLALPVLGEQFLNFCVGFYDVFLAGHLAESIREPATSAVGVGAYVGWFASLMFSLVAAGTTALVSRARGAGDFELANRVANRSMLLAGIAGVVFFALVLATAPLVPRLLDFGSVEHRITVRYLRIDAAGMLFAALSYIGAAALRGCGNTRTPMLILGTVGVLNMIVSTILVYGLGPIPAMGVDGIVAGTVTARISGGLLMVAVLVKGISGLKLHLHEMKLRGQTVRRVLTVGIPAAMDGIIYWIGHFIFLRIITESGKAAGEGGAAFAAHIVGIRLEAITYLPAVAWGVAASTLIGQSLGNDDKPRAVRAGHEATLQCGLLGVFLTLGFILGAEPLMQFMHKSPDVQEIGTPALRLMGFFQIPLIASIVYVSGLRGAGDTRFPLMMTIFTTVFVRLPLAWVGGVYFEGGLFGAWIGMCADMLIRGLIASWRFHSQRWVHTEV